MNKKLIIGSIAVALLAGGTAGGVIFRHNQESLKVATQKEKAEAKKDYDLKLSKAKSSLTLAEKSRKASDIAMVKTLAGGLYEKDKALLLSEVRRLEENLKLLRLTAEVVDKAAQSKVEADLSSAQQRVDGLKDSFLSADKEVLQARLEGTKKMIAEEKAKAAEAEIAAAVRAPALTASGGSSDVSGTTGEATNADGAFTAPVTPPEVQVPAQDGTNSGNMGSDYHPLKTQEEFRQAEEEAAHAPAFDWNQK
ncbi:hypothetical protein [Lactovum odontotermitis]